MPRLWNVDCQTAILSPDEPGVAPGDSHDFTDAEVDAGLSGSWSFSDPRPPVKAGRPAAKAAADPAPAITADTSKE